MIDTILPVSPSFADIADASRRRRGTAGYRSLARGRDSLDRDALRRSRLPRLGAAVVLLRPARIALAVRRARGVDSVDRREYFLGRRRLQRAADPADDDDGVHRGAVVVDRDHRAREGVLHLPAGAADRHARRVHGARLPAVLPVLGSDAGADVFPDRHLGQRPPALLGDQVLPLHAGRQRRACCSASWRSTSTPTRRPASTPSTSPSSTS